MTDDQVALDDWYPVTDAVPALVHTTRLLGHAVRVAFSGGRARVTALRADGREMRELPAVERFGLVWTTTARTRRSPTGCRHRSR
jgi:hypothetical protein